MLRYVPLVCILGLAGCSGGASTVPSLGALNAPAHAGILYVAGSDRISAFALDANGNAAPKRTVTRTDFIADYGIHRTSNLSEGIVAAPDGTLFLLTQQFHPTMLDDLGYCTLRRYAADADGAAPYGSWRCDAGYDIGLSLRSAGAIDILTTDGVYRESADTGQTLLNLGSTAARSGAEDAQSNVYVASVRPNRVDVYAANGPAAAPLPSRTIALPAEPGAVAVEPDGTLYVAVSATDVVGAAVTRTVLVFTPGATAPTRTLGPLDQPVSALAVDAEHDLYVALGGLDATTPSRVSVYAPGAAGGAAPLRVLQNPMPATTNARGEVVTTPYITGLAIAEPAQGR